MSLFLLVRVRTPTQISLCIYITTIIAQIWSLLVYFLWWLLVRWDSASPDCMTLDYNTSNESFFNFQICQMRYIFIKMSFRALLKQQSLVYSLNECSRVTGRGLGRGGVHVIAMELLQKWVLLSVISNGLLCKRRSKWIMERKRWNRDEMNHERPCVAVPLLWRKALQAGIQVSFECSSLLSRPPYLVSFCTFLIQQFSGFTSFDFQTKAHCYVCRITVVGVGFRVSSENNFSDI